MKLTKEQVLGMSREQLLAEEFRDISSIYSMHDEVEEHLYSVFADPVSLWFKTVEEAYQTKRTDMANLIESFKKEPSIIQLLAWSNLTRHGIEHIEFAKFVHRHFAEAVLCLFGDPFKTEQPRGVFAIKS